MLVKHGERWRRLRKVLHQGLQPKSAASYEPIQEAAARTVVRDLLADPDGARVLLLGSFWGSKMLKQPEFRLPDSFKDICCLGHHDQ